MAGGGRSLASHLLSATVLPRITLRTGEGLGIEDGEKGKRGRTFPANHLVAVGFAGQGLEGRFDDAAAETEDEVKGRFLLQASGSSASRFPQETPARFKRSRLTPSSIRIPSPSSEDLWMRTTNLLDVVVRQRTPVLQLLPGEDQALLVGRDALLVLNLGLHIVDGVGGFDLEGDGLAREGFDEAWEDLSVLCGLWMEQLCGKGGEGSHLHCD